MAGVAAIVTAGVIGVSAGTASAGCGLTLELPNRGSSSVTVDLDDSEVRVRRLGHRCAEAYRVGRADCPSR